MSTVGRRLVSCTIVGLALPLGIVTAPVWIPVAALVDAIHGLFRFPTIRLGLYAIVYLAHEWVGLFVYRRRGWID